MTRCSLNDLAHLIRAGYVHVKRGRTLFKLILCPEAKVCTHLILNHKRQTQTENVIADII